MTPISPRCGSCCMPLSGIDQAEGDGHCSLCRFAVDRPDDFVVIAVDAVRGVIAVEHMDCLRLANKVAWAWRRSRMPGVSVMICEPRKEASLLAG